MSDRQESVVRIACIQMEPSVGEKDKNVAKSLEMIERAADQGARLVVLPELCASGYVFRTREEAFALAEAVPGGPTSAAWSTLATRRGLYIVAGIAELAGNALYNSSVVLGPRGYIGTFRKMHLWNEENLFFEPGDLGFPESFRLCALQGADIICVPTNWVPIPGQAKGREAMANILAMAGAHSNSVFVAAADRVGIERGQPFVGQSVIVSYTGWPIGGPASPDAEEIIYADANLADARRKRNWNEYNQVLRDRRTDVYDEMLGSKLLPGWH